MRDGVTATFALWCRGLNGLGRLSWAYQETAKAIMQNKAAPTFELNLKLELLKACTWLEFCQIFHRKNQRYPE